MHIFINSTSNIIAMENISATFTDNKIFFVFIYTYIKTMLKTIISI